MAGELSGLERAIVAACARAAGEGLQPKSIYLTCEDYRELRRSMVDNLPVRKREGTGESVVACRYGILRAVRKRDRK